MLTLIFLFFINRTTFASTTIEVLVKHKYSENRTHLYEKNGNFFCDTELQKNIEIKGAQKSLPPFPNQKKRQNMECISQFAGTKITNGTKMKWEGCAEDPAVKPFLKWINRECAR